MNAHDTNTLTRTILGIARAGASVGRFECTNHRRDSEGWPLGNCVECAAFRKQMDAWHTAQVMGGNHDPDRVVDTDPTKDRNAAHADGWGWPE